ncbi:hypothetical protein AB0C33_35495 [Nonomuraea sp. NPDC048881]|uniref:hypothetical protein n=1 Tax=Nonomuraea sp. NPDC048881 TaxID=3155030 RepID=UPI0033D8F78E
MANAATATGRPGSSPSWGHAGSMAGGHTFRNAVTHDGERPVTLLIGTDEFDSARVDAVIGVLLRDLR